MGRARGASQHARPEYRGRNTGTPVRHHYESPFAFKGEIEKVTIHLAPKASAQRSDEGASGLGG